MTLEIDGSSAVSADRPVFTSAALTAWRDAAVSGGFPPAGRTDRWQPLRAGVVNLWEYDIAEVWYADGRMQLQGANESGKSTLMTLTTLLLLAGDVSGRNIDTLGESGKRFRYYVEPSSHPLDRRDPGRQKHRGWAWQEYGRITDHGPEYFTTLLFAEARRTDGDLKVQWCTLRGANRVRAGLALSTAGLIAEPQQVKDVPGFTIHRTGAAYREEIARTLWGTGPEWLDQLIRILRVVRTPKIGDRLDLGFLTAAFRNALPPLADDEIRQLADGWDQLERLRNERDTAEQAFAAISEFTRQRWQPWADTVIRAAADPVISAFTAFDNVTREERLAQQAAISFKEQVNRLDELIDADSEDRDRRQAEVEALQRDRAYLDAISAVATAEQLAERARERADLAERSADRAAEAEAELAPAREAAATATEMLHEAEKAAEAAADRVATHADAAGLVDATERFLPKRDTARLHHAAQHRLAAVSRILELIDEHSVAAAKADETASRAQELRAQTAAAVEQRDDAGKTVEAEVLAVAALLTTWARGLPEQIRPTPSLVESWVRSLSTIAEANPPVPVLSSVVAREHLDNLRAPLEKQAAGLAAALERCQVDQQGIQAELAMVERERDPRPADPQLWRRRERPDGVTAYGAPLWRLVEVVDDRADGIEGDLAIVEAALDASGVLQAWVTPDGTYLRERDGHDTVWFSPAQAASDTARSLRSVLCPADDAGPLTGMVDALLRAIGLGDDLPPTGSHPPLALTWDGRWRHGSLGGAAAPAEGGPRLLGAAARAADRQRRIGSLHARLAEAQTTAMSLKAEQGQIEELIKALDWARSKAPDDSAVVAAVLALRQAERHAAALAAAASKAESAARAARELADRTAASLASYANEHRLPSRREPAERVQSALRSFRGAVDRLADALLLLPQLRHAVDQQEAALNRIAEAARRAASDAARDKAEAERLKIQADAAASTLSQDAQQILMRVETLRREISEFDKQISERQSDREQLVDKKIRAESALEQVEQRRRRAEAERQTAVNAWFACVDTGLPRQRQLIEPPARHITAALKSAQAARAAITPRNWPDDPGRAASRVQAQWANMIEAVQILRSRLESLGGRTVRTTAPRDDGFQGAVHVVVDGTGAALPPPDAVKLLADVMVRLQTDYDEELTKTINELLGSAFIEHLRDRLVEAERLRTDINAKLAQTPTTTSGLMLRLVRHPVNEERTANEVLAALERDFGLLSAGVQEQIRHFLTRRIGDAQEAARASGDPDWRSRLAEILDYRRWFDLRLEYRTAQATANGATSWRPLNRDDHSLLSGGAKVVTLLQPFIAALHAMYDQSGVGPRMMWLDEAFDGVDPTNRATMLRLLTDCDLDWVVAGPATIANTGTVPVAAIYEVRRAPRPYPGVSLELAMWAGGEMVHLATPDPADLPDLTRPEPAPAISEPDLFTEPTP